MIEYTDHGMKEVVHLGELLPFEYFGMEFQNIPAQVYQIIKPYDSYKIETCINS